MIMSSNNNFLTRLSYTSPHIEKNIIGEISNIL